MREIVEYLKARYLTEKAQGMVEYALIIAFVVGIAIVLTSDGGLKDSISGSFSKAGSQMSAMNQ